MEYHAKEERMVQEFLQLTSLDSVSFHEKLVGQVLKEKLQTLGFQLYEDSGPAKGERGNLYGYLPGNSDLNPILLSAHMDTVEPGIGKKPRVTEDGRIISDGTTVLGADDVAGIVEILEAIRLVTEEGGCHNHKPVEVLFTVAEEPYAQGARGFDYTKLQSRDAYVLDMSGKAGRAAYRAPSIITFRANVTGKAAHAGFAPEKGINAIAAAARAVTRIPQGKVSDAVTLNIGTIQGGTADNIVSETCRCTGEARGFSHEETLHAVKQAEAAFQSAAEEAGAECTFEFDIKIMAYETDPKETVCRRFVRACREKGLPGELVSTHGGSDNNVFTQKGLEGIVLSCGMYNTHATNEYASVQDMKDTAELLAVMIVDRDAELELGDSV